MGQEAQEEDDEEEASPSPSSSGSASRDASGGASGGAIARSSSSDATRNHLFADSLLLDGCRTSHDSVCSSNDNGNANDSGYPYATPAYATTGYTTGTTTGYSPYTTGAVV